jgi:hypothetical protein
MLNNTVALHTYEDMEDAIMDRHDAAIIKHTKACKQGKAERAEFRTGKTGRKKVVVR